VLARLGPAGCAVLAQAGHPWLAAVLAANLPRAGKSAGMPRKLADFVGSVARLAWAKANGCPWAEMTSSCIAVRGSLEVLQWTRANDCPWDTNTCMRAALGGHLEVLKWAREHGCPWDSMTCNVAAQWGYLKVLKWAQEHDCPWHEANALFPGRIEVGAGA
jgi:hypothetical protein